MMNRQEFFTWARSGPYARCTTEQLYFAYEVYLTCPRSRAGRDSSHLDCGRCGNCCRRPWRIEVSLHDVRRWIDERRTDILESLERKPGYAPGVPEWGLSTDAMHLAVKAAACGEKYMATALAIAHAVVSGKESYVMPKVQGCKYLIEGERTLCSIYDTRPEVCRNFPSVESA